MPLHIPVIDTKTRPYCGATAIAILTGVPLSRVEKMIRRCRKGGYRDQNGRKIPIKGTYTWEVVKVLKRLGCKVTELKTPESTFARFVHDTAHISKAFLVNVTGHFMTSFQGTFCDNSNLDGPRPIEGYHKGQRRVQKAWYVEAPALSLYTIDDAIKATPAPKPKPDVKVVRAQNIAKQIAQWESKERRAKNALKKLRPKLAYYEKLGVSLTTN